MATDPDLNDGPTDRAEVWAPVPAWRTLALLHAAEAVAPLTGLFRRVDEDDDDAVGEDLPAVFGVLGAQAQRLSPAEQTALAGLRREPELADMGALIEAQLQTGLKLEQEVVPASRAVEPLPG